MKLSIVTLLLCLAPFNFASDHIGVSVTAEHAISDLADFYKFPAPSKDNHVVLVPNTHFAVYRHNHFNEGIVYKFHLNQAELDQQAKSVNIVDSEPGKMISCRFQFPMEHFGHSHGDHKIECDSNFGVRVEGPPSRLLKVMASQPLPGSALIHSFSMPFGLMAS
jgi:hypothetical protein